MELTLMTPCQVKVGEGQVVLAGTAKIVFQPGHFEVAVEEVKVQDGRLNAVWGSSLRRILLKKTSLPQRGELSFSIVEG